jgi:Spy/CpxP family protein refolding chaperone
MTTRLHTRLAAFAAASLLAFGTAALAQPSFHHHGDRGSGDIGMAIAALKGQLNLNTSQQQQWDSAAAASKAARETARGNVSNVHSTMTAELAKAEPNLAAVAAAADDAQAKNSALRKQVRDQWLALYATFTPDQKAVVRDALSKRVARMEQMRQKMLERHG